MTLNDIDFSERQHAEATTDSTVQKSNFRTSLLNVFYLMREVGGVEQDLNIDSDGAFSYNGIRYDFVAVQNELAEVNTADFVGFDKVIVVPTRNSSFADAHQNVFCICSQSFSLMIKFFEDSSSKGRRVHYKGTWIEETPEATPISRRWFTKTSSMTIFQLRISLWTMIFIVMQMAIFRTLKPVGQSGQTLKTYGSGTSKFMQI